MKWVRQLISWVVARDSDEVILSLGLVSSAQEGTSTSSERQTIWTRLAEPHVPVPHPANAPGAFYSENDGCITCGAPQAQAPDLVGWYEVECGDYLSSHCIFVRQPETPDEVEQAIRAMDVSCVQNLRYRGINPVILNRLRQMGMAHLCDTPDQQ